MEFTSRVSDGLVVVDLCGRLTASDRQGALRDAVTAATPALAPVVILNLADVQYLDSTRLGEIIALHINLLRDGRRLALAAVPDRVKELVELAGLSTVFQLFDSVEHATRASRASQRSAS